MRTECLKCGAALSRHSTGRPPRYCSIGCRRATEYELKRLQRRLEKAEEEVRGWSSEAATAPEKGSMFERSKAQCERSVAYWEDQRVALEGRMRELLDDPEAVS